MDSEGKLLDEQGNPIDEGQGNNQEQYVEINGEQISLEEVRKSYFRQADYTKKTQELAKERKEIEQLQKQVQQANDTDDVKAAEAFLKSKGYLTKAEMEAELESKLKTQNDERLLERMIDSNPSLKQHEEAIRKIAQVDNSAIEDIVVKYNFISSDKLSKAKSGRDIVGGAKKEPDGKPDIDSMTSEQREAYKLKNGIGKKGMFSGASAVRTL